MRWLKIFRIWNNGKIYLIKLSELPDNADKRGCGAISTSAQPRNVSWGPQPTAAVMPSAHLPQLLPWKWNDDYRIWAHPGIEVLSLLLKWDKIIAYRIEITCNVTKLDDTLLAS